MEKFLVVDEPLAKSLQLKNYVTLFPNHRQNCDWLIPKDQYSTVTTEIISASKKIGEILVPGFYAGKLPYKQQSLECLYNGFGGLLCFFIADRLLRVNKLMQASGESQFSLPAVKFNYDNTWSQPHLFYNVIEQNPDFNQWALNEIFHDWPQVENQTSLQNKNNDPLFFETFLPKEEGRKVKKDLFSRIKGKIWNDEASGLQKFTVFLFFQTLVNISWSKILKKLRVLRYWISSFGHDVAWDGIGPVPDPQYDHWGFFWPSGRLCFVGQDLVKQEALPGDSTLNREDFLKFADQLAAIFATLIETVDGKCLIEKKYLKNVARLFKTMAPRCLVEDAGKYAPIFLNQLKPFSNRSYFCGGTFAGYSSSFRMFASRELDIEITSTQHSAWGGYFANGPLVTEFLIKGSDNYVTFGWDQKPLDGSSWRHHPILLNAPLTSEMYNRKKITSQQAPRKRVLLCPGFIYRFPSIYNSALRVDNVKPWSDTLKEVVTQLCQNGLHVDILMYNNVMAGNMNDCLQDWLQGNQLAHEFPDHDVKVRYILNSSEFQEKYDAVIWDLLAGGFVESVATGIPTFALWSDQIHSATKEGQPFIEALKKEGVLFSSGQELVSSGLHRLYKNPDHFKYENNQALQAFFNSFVKINPDWISEWKNFFQTLK